MFDDLHKGFTTLYHSLIRPM